MATRQKVRKGLILVSFFLFPATFFYFSPALIIMAAAEGTVNGSFIVFALLFIGSLVLGRAFCGWVCPGAGCQEALFEARNRAVTAGDWIKWAIWVPWIGAIIVLAIRAGGYDRIDFFYRTRYGLSVSDVQSIVTYLLILLLLVVLPSLAVGRRSFCHHLCWMAPFMITGRKLCNWPSLGLNASPDSCVHCHRCTTNCPMSLPVEQMALAGRMEHSECILCGSCVDGCKPGTISFSWLKK